MQATAEARTRIVLIARKVLEGPETPKARVVPRKEAVRARRIPSRVTITPAFWSKVLIWSCQSWYHRKSGSLLVNRLEHPSVSTGTSGTQPRLGEFHSQIHEYLR